MRWFFLARSPQFFLPSVYTMALTVKGILKDKVVLYIVLFFAITNVIGFVMLQNIDAVVTFAIIALLTSYFTKNMIIVLLVALIATNSIVGAKRCTAGKEGFQEGVGHEGGGGKGRKEDTKPKPDSKKPNGKKHDGLLGALESKSSHGKSGKKEAMSHAGGDAPAGPQAASAAVDEEEAGGKPKLDQSATLESAYDNLNNLLGSDALANMTSDTQKLAEKQKQLMGNLSQLEPMIGKAASMLEGLDSAGSGLNSLMSKVGALAGGSSGGQ